MSLSSAMFSGISGLMAYGDAMNVTGDNIANMNTVGFKGSNTIFADILANSVANGSSSMQFGRGALIQNVTQSFTQGSFQTTGNSTDMGIQGSGFFVVREAGSGAVSYTRAGQFILDQNGLLVNPSQQVVQGYKLSIVGGVVTRAGIASDIDISGVQSSPQATTNFRLGLNLSAVASSGATFTTSFNAYNSLGEATTVTYTFTEQAASQTWNYAVTSSVGTVTAGGAGTVTFNSAGQITAPAADQSITISTFPSGAADLTMTWDLLNAGGISNGDITGYAAESVTNSIVQDGFSTGVLRGMSVDQEGIISGLFSNGQSQQIWQVQLADFLSPWGLTRQGNSLFGETAQSGQPVLGVAKAGGFGTIYGASLELSNVDLGQQFVDMIQNQRAYQASSRIITTVDDMMQEAVNLKR